MYVMSCVWLSVELLMLRRIHRKEQSRQKVVSEVIVGICPLKHWAQDNLEAVTVPTLFGKLRMKETSKRRKAEQVVTQN